MPIQPAYLYDLEGTPVIGQVCFLPETAREEIIALTWQLTELCFIPDTAFSHPIVVCSEPFPDGRIKIVVVTSFNDRPVYIARKAKERGNYMEILHQYTPACDRDSPKILRFTDPELEMRKFSYITLEKNLTLPWSVLKQWHVPRTQDSRMVITPDGMEMLLAALDKVQEPEKGRYGDCENTCPSRRRVDSEDSEGWVKPKKIAKSPEDGSSPAAVASLNHFEPISAPEEDAIGET